MALSAAGQAALADEAEIAKGPPRACLAWTAPAAAGCPAASEMEASVEAVLGRRVFAERSCDLQVTASMRPLARGWQADVSLGNRSGAALGTRTLETQESSCAALVGPAALVIALLVDTPDAGTKLHLAAPPSRAPAPSLQGLAFASFETTSGLLPNMDVGATLGLGADHEGLPPFRIHGTLWLPSSTEQAGKGGRFWAWHAGLSLCPRLLTSRSLAGAVCAGAQAGAVSAKGAGLDYGGPISRPYGHVEVRAMLSAPLFGPFAASAHVGAAMPWLRPRFVYFDDAGSAIEVHRPSVVALLVGLGIELRLPPSAPTGESEP